MEKFLTWQEYLEKFDSFQEAYENYYELYDELQRKDNIINDAIKLCEENAEAILEYEGDYYYMFEEIRDVLQGKEKEDDK